MEYVKSFGYINDMEYARSFIESRKDKKSRKELYAALSQKGVEKELIEQAFEECYGNEDSRAAIEAKRKKYGRHGKPRKYWVIWYAKASIMKTSVK